MKWANIYGWSDSTTIIKNTSVKTKPLDITQLNLKNMQLNFTNKKHTLLYFS